MSTWQACGLTAAGCVACAAARYGTPSCPISEKVIAAAEALAPVRRAIEAVAEATAEAAGSVEETPGGAI